MAVDVLKAVNAAPSITFEIGGAFFTLPTFAPLSLSEAITYAETLSSTIGIENLVREALGDLGAYSSLKFTNATIRAITECIETASGVELYDVFMARWAIDTYPEALTEDLGRIGRRMSELLTGPAWEGCLQVKTIITSKVERSSVQSADRGEERAYSLQDWILADIYRLVLTAATRGKSTDYHRLPSVPDNIANNDLEKQLHALNEGAQFEVLTQEQIDEYMDVLIKVQTGELPREALDPWRVAPNPLGEADHG